MRRFLLALLMTAMLMPHPTAAQSLDPDLALPPLVEAILTGNTEGLDPELAALLDEPFALAFGLIFGFVFLTEDFALSEGFAEGIVLTAPGGAGGALTFVDVTTEPGLAALTATLDLQVTPNDYMYQMSPN